jgi:hypothetical protein
MWEKLLNKGVIVLLLWMAITSEFLYQYNLTSQKVNRFVSHLEPQSGPVHR